MHKFKKSLGQNFLRDESILNKIINSFDVLENSLIIEVGPGDGALTKKLLTKNVYVLSFEIDESLKKYLDNINDDKLSVIYKDFLSVDLKDYIKGNNIYFVANVPYYITTPIISKFIDSNIIPNEMIMMVQKEVGKRLCSKPGNSDYGAISVILNYYFETNYLFDVDKTNFYPIPKVDSAVIRLVKRDKVLELNDINKFKKIVNDSFKMKRKNMRNNLKVYDLNIVDNTLKKYGFNLQTRAEEINYEVFVDLANNL